MNDPIFIPCDAHEGCVWIEERRRLYFSTTKKLAEPRVALQYLDFSDYDLDGDPDWSALTAQEWVHDARMANSMCATPDGRALLVAEQGDLRRPAALARYDLATAAREEVLTDYQGQPLNSPNKVILSRGGHLLFSDPDYGFRQDFRPPPVLEPRVYVRSGDGKITDFDCGLEMPHGLALSPDERTLFVTDTSNDGGHEDGVELHRRRSVLAFDFDPETGTITGDGRFAFAVDKGVPDGCITVADRYLVGGGDGVYVADLTGKHLGKIPLERKAVNLCAVADDRHLFVTADEGVYLIRNWRDRVTAG